VTGRLLDPALLSKLLDCSPGLVMVVDGDLQIRWVNAATGFTLGYSPDEAIGRSILEFLDPEWDEAAFRSIGTALASEGLRLPTTFRVISADGSTSMMEVTANSQFHDPDIDGFVVFARPWNERWLLDRTLDAMAADEPIEASLDLLVQVAGAETLEASAALMFDCRGGRVGSVVAAADLPIELTGPISSCPEPIASEWATLLEQQQGEIYDLDQLPPALGRAARAAGFASMLLWPSEPGPSAVAWAAAWRRRPRLDEDEARQAAMTRLATLAGLIVERGRAVADLAWAAAHDDLTGLHNRASLFEKLDERLDPSEPGPVGIIYVDLDGFKPVNDRYGHGAGDRVLQEVAERLRANVPEGSVLARLGGDEFVVVADLDADRLAAVARRIVSAVSRPTTLRFDDAPVHVGASAGVAVSIDRTHTPDQLVDAADRGMYLSKGATVRVTVIDP